MKTTAYDREFYENQRLGSQTSAQVIVPLLLKEFQVTSVIDVGCGVGPWLQAFGSNGVEDLTGLDGDYVDRADMLIPANQFYATDLTSDFPIHRRYDLACSLEVAEHLPVEAGSRFVSKLCEAAPLILFSAAIPGQSGTEHINEAWQDTWRAMFACHGYSPLDIIRSKVWGNHNVKWWYQQNTIVYADEATLSAHPNMKVVESTVTLNMVHPECYSMNVASNTMYLSKAVKQLPGLFVAAVRRRLSRK